MKYWLLSSEYPPFFGGGIGTYAENVALQLSRQGHEVTVFTRDLNQDVMEEPSENLRVVRFRHLKDGIYDQGYWLGLSHQFFQCVRDRIKRDCQKPDLIEFQDFGAIGFVLLQNQWTLNPMVRDIPTLAHLHSPFFLLHEINGTARFKFPEYWIGRLERFSINAATAVLSPSRFMKNHIMSHLHYPGKDVDILEYPFRIDPENLPRAKGKKFDAAYIGRLEYRKGVAQFLEQMEKIWKSGRRFTLAMIGGDVFWEARNQNTGDFLKRKYDHRIREGLLRFYPNMEPKKLYAMVTSARFAVVPSLWENYPYCAILSMALGVPLLVSAQGGQAEMVGSGRDTGLVFDWNQKDDLKEKFVYLLDQSPSVLARMGEKARKRIEAITDYSKNYEKRISLFERILKDHRPSRHFPVDNPFYGNGREPDDKTGTSPDSENLLSIIITCHNLGAYIEQALQSALDSNWKNREIIIIDDGSDDANTLKILDRIEKRNHREIKIIRQKNQGLADSRNIGAQISRGRFITFLDADDRVHPEFYTRAIDILTSYDNVSFVYSWLEFFGGQSDLWINYNTELPFFLVTNMLAPLAVTRRNLFLSHGRNRRSLQYYYEDYDGWLNMFLRGCSGVSIPEVLTFQRVRPDSMTRRVPLRARLFGIEQVTSRHPEIYEKYGFELFNLLYCNGPGVFWSNPARGNMFQNKLGMALSGVSSENEAILGHLVSNRVFRKLIGLFFKLNLDRLFR